MAGIPIGIGQAFTSPCLGSIGYIAGETSRTSAVMAAAVIRQAAAAIIAADNAARLVENYRDQRNIARRMNTIARESQDQLANVFWPREREFLAEFSEPEAIEDVEVMGRRYAGRLVAMAAKQFAEQIRIAKCNLSRYCSAANQKMLQDLMLARAAAFANARVTGRNLAFNEFRARTDRNYKRRMQAVSWGNGMVQQATQLYASAFGGYQRAGAALAESFNSSLAAFGNARGQYTQARQYRDALGQVDASGSYSNTYAPSPSGVPTFDNITAFGYSSVNTSFQGVDSSNVIDWNTESLANRGLPSSFFNAQSESINEAQVGQEDFVRTGIVSFPVIGMTGGTVLVNMDLFPLMNAKHKMEGLP